MKILRDRVREINLHEFFVDASDININTAIAPAVLDTDIGDGSPMVLTGVSILGDLRYKQSFGVATLTIFNDYKGTK